MPSPAHALTTIVASHLLAVGASGPSPLWYITRATGVVALLLLTGTVALGIAGTARLESSAMPRLVRSGLHRNLSILAVAFVAVHVVTTVLDPYAGIKLVSAVIPFSSSYRPLWLGLGAVAFDMLLALIMSSLIRARLPYRAWRAVHWLAYASWPAALWHGLGTGTDSKLPWLVLLDAACVLVVAVAIGWRIRLSPRAELRRVGLLATAGFMAATIVFTAMGPMQPGWARRAGTPVHATAERTGSNA
jgi:methionine sulfoxide reductase heme-binding subunit